MIRIEHVTRKFGRVTAVDGLSLEIGAGEIFGLVGPDGAGKTTTLRLLCGLLDPHAGRLFIAGLDVASQLDEVKDRLGYMAQRFGLYPDLTVEENMWFYADLFGLDLAECAQRMTEFLAMTRMTPFRDRPAAQLSGGMKQKLALMTTLLHKPQVLLLDEPTNGVDPLSRRDFWQILYRLAREGMTILVSTAYLDEAERCDRVGLMYRGRLIECNTPAKLKNALAPRAFQARPADVRACRALLLETRGVLAAEPAGHSLHVALQAGALRQEVEHQSGVTLEPLAPSLEDVFIARIREEELRAAA
jgi:ABC-2 type transport system ATP-binding protein